jgi:anti-repressor protein
MKEIIKITGQNGQKIVSARELHQFLEVETDFTTWCKRMFEYGFEEGMDFTPILGKSTGGRPSMDYALTLDTAKEISMLQRSEKGKQARQYFIECEKKLLNKTLTAAELLLENAKMLVINEQKLIKHNHRIEKLEAQTITKPDYYTIVGYSTKIGTTINYSTAAQLGKKASKLCKKHGLPKDSTTDPRFGKVGMYPTIVLAETFNNFQR